MTKLLISSESSDSTIRGQYRLTRHLRGLLRRHLNTCLPSECFSDFIDAHGLYGLAQRVQAVVADGTGNWRLDCVNARGQAFSLYFVARRVRVAAAASRVQPAVSPAMPLWTAFDDFRLMLSLLAPTRVRFATPRHSYSVPSQPDHSNFYWKQT